MIISCVNCNKKFNLDEKLIPDKGRLLQCSSCNHKWHFSLLINKEIKLNNEKILKNEIKEIKINPSLNEIKEKKTSENIIIDTPNKLKNNNKKNDIKKKQAIKKNNSMNIYNLFLIFIISLVALILILDTFKQYLGIYFPGLLPLMDNLYQTLIDIKFFVKDLIS